MAYLPLFLTIINKRFQHFHAFGVFPRSKVPVRGAPPPTPSPEGRGLWCRGCASAPRFVGASAPTPLLWGCAPHPFVRITSRRGGGVAGAAPLHPASWGLTPRAPLCEGCAPTPPILYFRCHQFAGAASSHPFQGFRGCLFAGSAPSLPRLGMFAGVFLWCYVLHLCFGLFICGRYGIHSLFCTVQFIF